MKNIHQFKTELLSLGLGEVQAQKATDLASELLDHRTEQLLQTEQRLTTERDGWRKQAEDLQAQQEAKNLDAIEKANRRAEAAEQKAALVLGEKAEVMKLLQISMASRCSELKLYFASQYLPLRHLEIVSKVLAEGGHLSIDGESYRIEKLLLDKTAESLWQFTAELEVDRG